MVNTAVLGKPAIWEQGGWATKIGGPMMLNTDEATARAYKCNPKDMAEYAQVVFANTDGFLAGLKDGDLEREINLVQFGFPNNMSLGDFLTQALLGNTYAHTGEISSLKGSLGKSGYPF